MSEFIECIYWIVSAIDIGVVSYHALAGGQIDIRGDKSAGLWVVVA